MPDPIPFRIEAIPGAEIDEYRRTGVDRFGNPFVATVNHEEGGTPLRCCLTEAAVGERVALAAYRPFGFDGHFAEVGPVYVHADACDGYSTSTSYPAGFRHRAQVFRAYGHDHRIVAAELVEGAEAEAAIARMLADPGVSFLHSRNVLYGCYMFAIHRAGD